MSVKVFGDPTYICTVKRGHFTPPPAIDSAIIAVNAINKDSFTTFTAPQFFNLLHLAFGQKRKQLAGNLKKQFAAGQIFATLEETGILPSVRAEDLTLEQFLLLASSLYKSN